MSEKFIYISVNWAGKLVLWNHNVRKCKCRMCEQEVAPGAGYQFKKARFSSFTSGFLCSKCVAGFMRTCERWHFNSMLGCLFPAIGDFGRPRLGEDLAKAWLEGGVEKLDEVLG